VKLSGIDDYGRVYARAPEHHMAEVEGFERCSKEAIAREGLERIGTGSSPPARRRRRFDQDRLHGLPRAGTDQRRERHLVLDTGASQTMISPEMARRAGMEVKRGAPLVAGNVVGGRRVSVPLVRARSVSVGTAAVEDLDIGVFDALPGRPEVDGLLARASCIISSSRSTGKINNSCSSPSPRTSRWTSYTRRGACAGRAYRS